ncbi:MAG: RNA pseudouridine synthase [Saprospiraceae bacterium]|nr:RNA pseudouridine synthase [Saprospiraceae bacterium]
MNINIVFENNDILVINKPFGLQVEPDKNNHPNLLDWVQQNIQLKSNQKIFVVNRIDRPTSGLVLFAKNKSNCIFLQKQWIDNVVSKKYFAIVEGNLSNKESDLQHFIRKDVLLHKAIVNNEQSSNDFKLSKLNYSLISSIANYSLLQIRLITGRYHQIRAQLAFIEHPLWNDELYGAKKIFNDSCIGLHCYFNSFMINPGSKTKEFIALPNQHPAFEPFKDVDWNRYC